MAAYLFKNAEVYVTAAGAAAAAGDAIRTDELTLNFASGETNRRPTGGAAMGTHKTYIGGMEGSVTCKVPLRGSSAAGTAPEMGPLLTACNMTETIAASTSVTYTPANAVPSLYDVLVQIPDIDGGDSYQFLLEDCVGNLVLDADRNGPVFITVELKGVFNEPTNSAALGATGLSTIVPAKFKGTTLTWDTVATHLIESFSFDLGNEIVMRPSMTSADGYASAMILSRSATGSINPEVPAIATYDFFTKMTGETIASFAFSAIGTGAGNIATITMAQAQINAVQLQERAGITVADIGLDFHEALSATGGSADDISIAFT